MAAAGDDTRAPPHQQGTKKRKTGDNVAPAATARADEPLPCLEALITVPSGLPTEPAPSPGAAHACRVAALAPAAGARDFAAVFASGGRVYYCTSAPQPIGGVQEAVRVAKEGVSLPTRREAPPARLLKALAHGGEVQSLCLGGGDAAPLLATVDCFGHGTLSRLGATTSSSSNVLMGFAPQGAPREPGWAGVALGAGAAPPLAVAREFARDITFYDGGNCDGVATHRASTCLPPRALEFLPLGGAGAGAGGAQLLAVAEGHLLSLWDARAGGAAAAGCVARLPVAAPGSPLHCLAWAPLGAGAADGLIGAAGEERSLYMVEPRKWRLHTKWAGPTRQAVHQLSFLDAAPRYAVLSGLDFEVLCGRWDKPPGAGAGARAFPSAGGGGDGDVAAPPPPVAASAAVAQGLGGGGFSFRGDSRWLGVAKARGGDVLAGFGASGAVVFARVGVRRA